MTLSYFLSCLYDNQKSFATGLVHGPTDMISKSVYAKGYKYDRSKAELIHSGFSFELSYGKTMELYYDLTNNVIVRQEKFNNNPQILGLVYYFGDIYVSSYENKLLTGFDTVNQEYKFVSFDNFGDISHDAELIIAFKDSNRNYKAKDYLFNERVLSLDGYDFEIVGKPFATKRELNQAIAEIKRHQGHLDDGKREMDSWEDDFGEWR